MGVRRFQGGEFERKRLSRYRMLSSIDRVGKRLQDGSNWRKAVGAVAGQLKLDL